MDRPVRPALRVLRVFKDPSVTGTFTMPNTNGPSAVTLTGSAAFNSASSYFCAINDATTAGAQAKLVTTSGTAFTLATVGASAMNDVISFVCFGS